MDQTGKKKDHPRKKGNNILSLIQYKKNLKFANGKKNLKICFSSYKHSGSVLLRPQFKKSLDFQIFLIGYFKKINVSNLPYNYASINPVHNKWFWDKCIGKLKWFTMWFSWTLANYFSQLKCMVCLQIRGPILNNPLTTPLRELPANRSNVVKDKLPSILEQLGNPFSKSKNKIWPIFSFVLKLLACVASVSV